VDRKAGSAFGYLDWGIISHGNWVSIAKNAKP
jgi:hypothetical protein